MKLDEFLENLKSGKLTRSQCIKLESKKSPYISDEEAKVIANQLKSYRLPMHSTLDLIGSTIGDIGAIAIVEAVISHSNHQHLTLDFSENNITDEGKNSIKKVINHSLEEGKLPYRLAIKGISKAVDDLLIKNNEYHDALPGALNPYTCPDAARLITTFTYGLFPPISKPGPKPKQRDCCCFIL